MNSELQNPSSAPSFQSAGTQPLQTFADLPLGPAHTIITREGRLHLAYIDGLRALAALYVVSVHLLPRAWGQHRPDSPVLRVLAKLTSGGHFAVTTFIVISGFCLMLPVTRSGGTLKGGTRVFFTRRFWRIAPPLYLVFLLSCAVLQLPKVHAIYGPAAHVTLRQWVAHLLLVQFPTPGGMLPNAGILWSISVECVMYLFFPIFVFCSHRAGTASMTLIYLLAGYALSAVLRGTVIGQIPWQYLGAFAIGCLAAQIAYGGSNRWPNWKDHIPWGLSALVMFILFAAGCAVFGWGRVGQFQWAFDVPVFLAAAALLVGASREGTNYVRTILQTPLLAWIGVFSYSLYMVHYQLADVLEQYVLSHVTANQMVWEAIIVTTFVPLLVLCAYLFYVGCERPFHLIARRIGR